MWFSPLIKVMCPEEEDRMANSIDPDPGPDQPAPSDLGLHRLP